MLGKGAGGADVATAGPYAGQDFGPDTSSSAASSSGVPLTNALSNASALSGMNLGIGGSLVPTDTNAYQTLLSQIQDILGGKSTFDRTALLNLTSPSGGGSASSIGTTPTSVSGLPAATTGATLPKATDTSSATPYIPPTTPGDITPGGSSPSDNGARVNNQGLQQAFQQSVPTNPAAGYSSTINDRAAEAITGLFPGMTGILKGGNALQKFNKPGDLENPNGTGPTDPNIDPNLTPYQNSLNKSIAAQYLGNNEANGGL
jgi:hypothetical protein